jgi:hypothetical protein
VIYLKQIDKLPFVVYNSMAFVPSRCGLMIKIYTEAAHRSIIPLKVPINIVSVKTCLAYQIPVLIGIQLHRNEAYNNHGYVHIPKISPNEGFHACLVVGYNDRNQHFIIRNSWGSDWVCK